MGGIALIARQLGFSVTGSDQNVYPPMSSLLQDQGIIITSGYEPDSIPRDTDLTIVGNAMSRGNPAVEYILNKRLPYTSGPEWLRREVLQKKRVIAVAGTHGKTTTTSMICHILDQCGISCGFLVGGVPGNFDVSSRLGDSDWFVIEADEYDTAFFDKRSKFVHYVPSTVVLNNLEFDHADIFDNLEQIKTQFHHLIRTVPGNGQIICNGLDDNLKETLKQGCWSEVVNYSGANSIISCIDSQADYSSFEIAIESERLQVNWDVFGEFNYFNATCHFIVASQAHVIAICLVSFLKSLSLSTSVPPTQL